MKKKLRRSEKKLATYSNAYHWNSKHSIHSVTTAPTPAYMKSTYIKHMYNNLLKLLVFVVLFCFVFLVLCFVFFVDVSVVFTFHFVEYDVEFNVCWCIYATGWLAACLSRCLLAICFGVCSSLSVPNFLSIAYVCLYACCYTIVIIVLFRINSYAIDKIFWILIIG